MIIVIRLVRVVAILAGLVVAQKAWACSCYQMEPDAFATKVAILFEGRLLRNEPLPPPPETSEPRIFAETAEGVFKVLQVYKGDLGAQVRIRYWLADGGNCGISFRPYEKVTIAAYGDPQSGYVTNMCWGVDYEPYLTQVLDAVARHRQRLKAGAQPE